MHSLQFTAHIPADGMLHIPAPEFAGQDIDVIVLLIPKQSQPPATLIGQDALKLAQEIGFIGSLDAEPDLSARYKEELDWTEKT